MSSREAMDVGQFNRKVIEERVHSHMNDWRALLPRHVQDGRQLLRELLAGPLRSTPDGRTYRFEGKEHRSEACSRVRLVLHLFW